MFKPSAPKSHPRYLSLYYRDLLANGVKKNITSLQGLTAHGRGEAYDYLIGEKTGNFAQKAIDAAAAMIILAKHPVISVNGNTAILVPDELIKLSSVSGAKLEVNIFHKSNIREKNIYKYLIKKGATEVLLPDIDYINNIESNRKTVNMRGQAAADVVFIPLEDGDRTLALKNMGKKVITCDLNPLSRTAQTADITIVDNIVRSLPLIINRFYVLKKFSEYRLKDILNGYNNKKILSDSLLFIVNRLSYLAKT